MGHLWGSSHEGIKWPVGKPNDVARYGKDGSEILIKQDGQNPRRLTPRECARLMGFDRPKGSAFKIPVSDAQAYRQFGNAVVVPVAEALARQMAPYLIHERGTRQELLCRNRPAGGIDKG